MGLMDILNGMQNGPRGQKQPTPPGQGGGGMSPIMMALLGLLAYKAVKGMTGSGHRRARRPGHRPRSRPAPAPRKAAADSVTSSAACSMDRAATPAAHRSPCHPARAPVGGGNSATSSAACLAAVSSPADVPGGPMAGNAGGMPGGLGGVLGGLLGGAAAGSVLNGGLGQVLQDLQRSGQGRTAQSWISRGENESIAPDDLANALGADTINTLSQRDRDVTRRSAARALSQNLPDLVDQLTPDGRLPSEEEASRW